MASTSGEVAHGLDSLSPGNRLTWEDGGGWDAGSLLSAAIEGRVSSVQLALSVSQLWLKGTLLSSELIKSSLEVSNSPPEITEVHLLVVNIGIKLQDMAILIEAGNSGAGNKQIGSPFIDDPLFVLKDGNKDVVAAFTFAVGNSSKSLDNSVSGAGPGNTRVSGVRSKSRSLIAVKSNVGATRRSSSLIADIDVPRS